MLVLQFCHHILVGVHGQVNLQFRPTLFETEDQVPSTLNPLLPESFEFVCNLYESLLPHFSSQYVNIGLDEAYGLGRYQIEEY